MRFVFQYGGGIFCYFVIQPFGCVPSRSQRRHHAGTELRTVRIPRIWHNLFPLCVLRSNVWHCERNVLRRCYTLCNFRCLFLGWEDACSSSLPPTLAHPIPRFFRAPPNPVCSCPLKWFMLIMMSASAIAVPILGVGQYSPSIGISL